jgi:pilus assembly protein CpaC
VVSFLEVDELAQVMVSIRVLQVDRGKARKMGINFRLDAEHISIGNYVGPQSPGGLPGQIGGRPDVGFGAAAALATSANVLAAFVDNATSIFTAIDFLDSKNLVRSVAEPNILTLSGEPATVLVGGEVPIPTASTNQVATVSGFFFQDFGVRLDIRPTVDAAGIVTLEVAPSIVRPDGSLGIGQVPGFQVQTVQTTARVAAGESLVLGGLLTFEEGLEQRGLPGLEKIPIFRWKNKTHTEQELLFVITPRLMGIASDAAREAELGPLAWPEERGEWIEAMPAPEYELDGVPPSFVTAPEPAVVTPGVAPVPAPVEEEPVPAPAPIEETPIPEPATESAPEADPSYERVDHEPSAGERSGFGYAHYGSPAPPPAEPEPSSPPEERSGG